MASSNILVTFGERVRALRKRKGWTQAEMADFLGIDRSYLAGIESGKRNLSLLNIKVISDGLGISLSKLFTRL